MNLPPGSALPWLPLLLGAAAGCMAGITGCGRNTPQRSRGPEGVLHGAEAVHIDRGRFRGCLLLHGFASSPADFRGVYRALDDAGWDVHAPRLPGHGTSPDELAQVSAPQMREGARRHYRKLRRRYDTVALVGFSMGGLLATGLAASEPPDALALVSPFYAVTYRWYYVLPAEWWFSIPPPVLDAVPSQKNVNRPAGKDNIVGYHWYPMPALDMLFTLKRDILRETRGRTLSCPVLLVYSAGDGTASPEAMQNVLGRLTGGDYRATRFERSNHYILHDYDRRAARRAIVDFLERQERAGG